MTPLFMLDGTVERDPAIEAWMRAHDDDLGAIAKHWWTVMRECGSDVREATRRSGRIAMLMPPRSAR